MNPLQLFSLQNLSLFCWRRRQIFFNFVSSINSFFNPVFFTLNLFTFNLDFFYPGSLKIQNIWYDLLKGKEKIGCFVCHIYSLQVCMKSYVVNFKVEHRQSNILPFLFQRICDELFLNKSPSSFDNEAFPNKSFPGRGAKSRVE